MNNLINISKEIRFKMIEISSKTGIPHLASSLSCVDIIIFLYEKVLNNIDFTNTDRDRFILSKGHAATAIYSVLNYKKIISDEDFFNYGKSGSRLEEHPSPKVKGIEAATGSLGHGLPIGCGLSISAKIKNKKSKYFVLMGDGECNEGAVWESALFASSKKLDNLFVYVDYNKWQATGRNSDIINLDSLSNKFKSFNWEVFDIDGNNFDQLKTSYEKALTIQDKPKIFIAHTIKGKGVSFMEDDNNWHYKIPNEEEVRKSKIELGLL